MTIMIETSKLTKRVDHLVAVEDFTIEVDKGEVLGFSVPMVLARQPLYVCLQALLLLQYALF